MVGLFEAHEIRIFKRKKVQDPIQTLQAQAWKKNGSSNKFKGKIDKTRGKKSWSNTDRGKVDDRVLNPRKEEKEIMRKIKKIKMCVVATVKSRVTWLRNVGTRKIKDRQKARTNE